MVPMVVARCVTPALGRLPISQQVAVCHLFANTLPQSLGSPTASGFLILNFPRKKERELCVYVCTCVYVCVSMSV